MALGLITWLLTGIRLETTDVVSSAVTMLIVAVIFGIVNAVVKPLAETLGGCMVLLTLGLFLWVINAAMLVLTSWISGQFGLGWSVDGWGTAFLGSALLSFISLFTHKFTEKD